MSLAKPEWRTRKQRIDPKLDAAGWRLPRDGKRSMKPSRSVEEATSNGPADYALWLNQHIVGVVEAKKLTLGPQNVLTQAQRYAKGIATQFKTTSMAFAARSSTRRTARVFWFHDVRHSLNRSRRVAAFHTPAALLEMLGRDFNSAATSSGAFRTTTRSCARTRGTRTRPWRRPLPSGSGTCSSRWQQVRARPVAGQRDLRLMKSGVAKRVLFLVDRRALAAQAVRAFSSFDAEPGQKFNQVYEVYSSKFQREDFGEEEKFDPKLLPKSYLTDPKPGQAFVYVATIQRMAINVLGRQAIFGLGDEEIDEDAGKLDIPIHAFDLIVADECHRGYTSQEVRSGARRSTTSTRIKSA